LLVGLSGEGSRGKSLPERCASGRNWSVCIAAAEIAIAKTSQALDESLSKVVGTGPADVSSALLDQRRDALTSCA
jgi:hypothetical protein